MTESSIETNYNRAKLEADKVDLLIAEALEDGSSFLVEAGAGSGKTYSLNQAAAWVQENKWAEYRKNAQSAVCVTYTNAAVEVIREKAPGRLSCASANDSRFCLGSDKAVSRLSGQNRGGEIGLYAGRRGLRSG